MIVLATAGSLGDLHPYLAVGRTLKARGHRVAVATVPAYRARVEAAGLEMRGVGPDIDPEDPEVARHAIDVEKGSEYIFRELLMPHVRRMLEDTRAALADAKLVLGHPIALTVPIAAEERRVPWISVALAPLSFLSAYEPLRFAGNPVVSCLMRGPVWLRRGLLAFGRWKTKGWLTPLYDLRRELGLPEGPHPLFEGQHSPIRALALFSRLMGERKPDWPLQTVVTGFCFYDGGGELAPELERFLADGPPPLVFTLGSSAVHDPRRFYDDSLEAARAAGRRAVLLGRTAPAGGRDVLKVDYAPYAKLFRRAAAVVASAGAGTIGQGLAAGRPMLLVPFGNDQPDNAARVERLGVSRTVPREAYNGRTAAAALRSLLEDPGLSARAEACARTVAEERGVEAACDEIEEVLGSR